MDNKITNNIQTKISENRVDVIVSHPIDIPKSNIKNPQTTCIQKEKLDELNNAKKCSTSINAEEQMFLF